MHPGARVLKHAGSGFTLTVQHGSLHCPIGPIYVEDCVKIVKSDTDRMHYLISTVVCCEPSGREFPSSKPLLMDFPIGDRDDTTEISDTFKVCLISVSGMVNIYRNGSPVGTPDSSGI